MRTVSRALAFLSINLLFVVTLFGLFFGFGLGQVNKHSVLSDFADLTTLSPVAHAQADDGIDWDAGETATTSPKVRTPTVTLSINDSTPPTVPILVSPPHQSVLVTSLFPFIWKESTDDFGMAYYQLYINGNLVYNNIQPSHTTSQYTTTISGDQITLMPVTGLADGTYTWKIRAVDIYDNFADSATWSFTIDTTAPILIITQIGEQSVSISSQDSTTIPTSPVEITTNPPNLVGTTEPNTTIQLTISIPGQDSITLQTTADSSGNYQFELPKLPYDVVIMLQLIAQDSAGNTAIITDVPILIKKPVITFPPPFDEILPEIPVPDLEILEEVAEEIREIIETVPEIIFDFLPPHSIELFDIVRPLQNVPFLALFPVVLLTQSLWFAKVGVGAMSPMLTYRALESIGLWFGYLIPPFRHPPKGIAFDLEAHTGIPHAHLELWRKDPELDKPVFVDERITDSNGLYRNFSVEVSNRSPEVFLTEFFLIVKHRTHIFSPELSRAVFRPFEEVYVGEYFTPSLCKEAYILKNKKRMGKDRQPAENQETLQLVPWIPMSHAKEIDYLLEKYTQAKPGASPLIQPSSVREEKFAKVGKGRIIRASTLVLSTLTAIGGVITWLYPNPWNAGIFVLYLLSTVRAASTRYMPGFVQASREETAK